MIDYPMRFNRVTAPFDYYTVNGKRSMHYAADFARYDADPRVFAPHDGRVIQSFYDAFGGNMLVLRGHFGGDSDIVTRYAHLARREAAAGDTVSAGTVIGIQGNTGSLTTGQHLHFETWILPKMRAYVFSDRPRYAVDPLAVCRLLAGQVFDANGKTKFLPVPEEEAECEAPAGGMFAATGRERIYFYPSGSVSPAVGGTGREKQFLRDFLTVKDFAAARRRKEGEETFTEIETDWGRVFVKTDGGEKGAAENGEEETMKQVGVPAKRDRKKEQFAVSAETLRGRSAPDLAAPVLGYVTPGIYDLLEQSDRRNVPENGYLWFRIGDSLWCAFDPDWAEKLPGEAGKPGKEELLGLVGQMEALLAAFRKGAENL